ncbi:hypothetical protein SAMN05421747_1412 [Parapedobacter composti]|uniref:YD repeat-containing protein n=1 Tax=Parapedobacter composti TaxID=623281 RepID=A0A1I1MK43_9SPHI|nr:hypothetical protein [Parapedobacter composti]SFC85807.1 hypothetical protein SAMN05421747_1412 [Parapedobacter composti]
MKKINRVLIAVCTSGMLPALCQGQVNNIVPVSPEAAALGKMVNYPVNLNTGIPDINIPLHEISIGGLKLHVTLYYHAGGFKINEQATRVGLGWSLSTDLQITRTINDKDDFHPQGYINNNLMKAFYHNQDAYGYPLSGGEYPNANAYYLAFGQRDGMPDKFNYRLLNKSGSFYFQKNDSGTGYTIVPVPYDNVKIQYENGRFIITDTDGTVYYFGDPGGGGSVDQLLARGRELTNETVTAWRCKRIQSSSGIDDILFSYTPKMMAEYVEYTDYVEYYENDNPCNLTNYYRSDQHPMTLNNLSYENLVTMIPFYQISSPKYMEVTAGVSPGAKFHVPYLDAQQNVVDKVYPSENIAGVRRSEIRGLSVSEISFRGGKLIFDGIDNLNSIRLLDRNGIEVKSWHFFQSYENAWYYPHATTAYNGAGFQGTRYLDSLHVRHGTETYECYRLMYRNKFCFGNHLKGHDVWGYCNANTRERNWGGLVSLPLTAVTASRYYFSINYGCMDFASNVNISFGGHDRWAEKPDEEAMKRGILERIVYPTGGSVSFDFEANRYQERFTGIFHEQLIPQLCGGLRIRNISYYDAGATLPSTMVYYRYGDLEEGTGVLCNRPQLTTEPLRHSYDAVKFQQDILYLATVYTGPYTGPCLDRSCLAIRNIESKTTYRPASVLDYTYSNGSPIYYTKVTTYNRDLGENTGKTVTEFYSPETFLDGWSRHLLNDRLIEGTNISWLKTNGLIGARKSVTNYRYNKDVQRFEPINRRRFEYMVSWRTQQLRVVFVFPRVLYQIISGNFGGNLYDNGKPFAASMPYWQPDFIMGQYGIPVGSLLLTAETEEWFDEDEVQTLTTTYQYDKLPNFLNPSRVIWTDSKGHSIRKDFRYAYDLTGDVYGQMVTRNMVGLLIETVETNQTLGVELSRERTNYAVFPVGWSLIAPASVERSVKGEGLETDITFNAYDQYGNVLQLTERDGITTSYLWGYNALYPVARLRGVDYSSIPSAYTANVQVMNPVSDASLRTFLDGLRNHFLGDQEVSSYTYKQYIGLSSETRPNGLTSFYEYDGIGRLVLERDHDQNLTKEYDYSIVGPKHVSLQHRYTNIPLMRTYNLYCTQSGEPAMYNYMLPGGMHSGTSQAVADDAAQTSLDQVFPHPSIFPCNPMGNAVRVDFFAMYHTAFDHPEKMEVDFLQNGHVVATHTFQYNHVYSYPIATSTLYLPAGQYQISFRPSADVNYDENFFMGYGIITHETSQRNRLSSGDTFTLQYGRTYEIRASNYVFQ